MLADVMILVKNPLDNIRNTNAIKYVMKNGRLYLGDSLDEVYPREQKAPEFNRKGNSPSSSKLPGIGH